MKQATAVRLFLLGLPIGLVVTSTISLLWHFNQPKESGPPVIYTDLAEEITSTELASYVNNLSNVIGPRHLSDPETLDRAANYIESTLGPLNIGFQVAEQVFDVDGHTVRNLWVEIPGGKRRNECVVVVAHFDALQGSAGANDNASSVAALLALAENFVQEKPALTLRFAWLTNGTPPHAGTPHSGAAQFADLLKREGDIVHSVFCLDQLGAYPMDHEEFVDALRPLLPNQGPFLSLLSEPKATNLLAQASNLFSSIMTFTVHQASLTGEDAAFFEEQGAGAFQAHGFPTLLVGGNAMFLPPVDRPVNSEELADVTRALATLLRILTNPVS